MKVKEFYVQDRRAIAVTSMVGMGDTIYLGLTGGSYSLAKFHIPTETMSLCCETFPHLAQKQYCTKIHNSMGKLDDRYIVIGEGNHFSWDGLPVYSAYLKAELPEISVNFELKSPPVQDSVVEILRFFCIKISAIFSA